MEAAQASLRFLDIAPWEVTAPLWAAVYLSPFADLCRINFSLWLFGPSGSFKSTLAALALSHFGVFDERSLPINWLSTVNSLEKVCFVLKDSLAVIDDFTPPTNGKESQVQMEKASRLIYQVGNRSARGRLGPDLKARPNYYPRCLIISTGELLLPGQRQSATARYLGVELDPKKTPVDQKRLSAAQEKRHLYAEAMAAYLADLAPNVEDAQETVQALVEAYRGAFKPTGHLRIPEIQAWLTVGFEFGLRFHTRMGVITEEQAYQMLKKAWGVFEALGEAHAKRVEGERPTLKFLGLLGELFSSGRIYAESIDINYVAPPGGDLLGWQGVELKAKNAFLVGWADENTLYFLPGKTYEAVNESLRGQGDFMGLGKNELLAALAREGFIEISQGGEHTSFKWIRGGSRRVAALTRKALGHDEAAEDERKQSTFL